MFFGLFENFRFISNFFGILCRKVEAPVTREMKLLRSIANHQNAQKVPETGSRIQQAILTLL